MITYEFMQHYWWLLVSLLGALLVFLMFVQGGNTLIYTVPQTEEERKLLINSTGRKWEFTFTMLVVFGGAFFASFPLFYSTSFGGAYWVWVIILFSFIVQAVAYEFQGKTGSMFWLKFFRGCLLFNGFVAPILIGGAVSTFFEGSAFIVDREAIAQATMGTHVISRWANEWRGLDVLFNPWTYPLALSVLFLARMLGSLYFLNNLGEVSLHARLRRQLLRDTVPFLLFFLTYVGHILTKDGFAVNPATAEIYLEPYKYLNNLLTMPLVLALFIVGVGGVLYGTLSSIFGQSVKGIWCAGGGTILTVLALLLIAGYNNTAYYPSTADLQSSLYLANSCSSEFTLQVMSIVSLIAPIVAAYMAHAWYSIDRTKLTKQELEEAHHSY